MNIRESTQMVAALRARNVPVEFVVYPDEGHGFVPADQNAFLSNILWTWLPLLVDEPPSPPLPLGVPPPR